MLEALLRSSLFRAASIYGVANVVRQAIPFLLVPVLTRYLTPDDYGVVSLFSVAISVLIPIVGLNLHGALGRKYFDRAESAFPAYVFACLALIAIASTVMALVVILCDGPIARLAHFPRGWLWSAVVTASAQMVLFCTLALLQVQGRPARYGTLQITSSVLVAGMTLGFVVGARLGWKGSILGQLTGSVAIAIVSLLFLSAGGFLNFRVERAHVRHALGFGVPLVPHALSGAATLAIDRLFVTHYRGLEQTGLYSLGYQVGMVIMLLQDSFNNAWQPWLFERLTQGGDAIKRNIVRFTYLYFVAIVGLALLLGTCAPWVLSIIAAKRFHGAYVYVLWIGLGYAFEGMYKMVGGYLYFAERTAILSLLTTIAMLVHVACDVVLVPRYGALGAAQSTTIAFATSFVLTWIASIRIYPMPWLRGLYAERG